MIHFAIQRDVLLKLLKDVAGILPVKTTQQMLTMILFELSNEKLVLKATDQDMYIESSAKVIEYNSGRIAIPGKKIIEIISKLPSDLITIKSNEDDTQISLTCKKSNFSIITQNPDGYPNKTFSDSRSGFIVPLNLFIQGINQTIFAVTGSDLTSVLSGLYCSIKDNILEFAGTDVTRVTYKRNHLLATVDAKAATQATTDSTGSMVSTLEKSPDLEVILPVKACLEILRLFSIKNTKDDDAEQIEEIKIVKYNDEILFVSNDIVFSTKLIAGKYPAFKTVFPESLKYSCQINRDEFLKATERVGIMSDESTSFISLYIENSNMTLATDTKDLGNANEDIAIKFDGDKINLALKTPFLTDVLKRLDCENIEMQINSGKEPIIIKPSDDDSYNYLLMPVKLV